jgi:S-adenosylmethionine uptake transporter
MRSLGSQVYLRGIFWFTLVSLISAVNDALVKWAGLHLSGIQVAFLRFLFSMLTLLPFMLWRGGQAFMTDHVGVHALRSLFLFLGLVPWCYGVIALPLPLVTTLSFTTPFFTLVLSYLFLSERMGSHRVFATLLGFLGIVVAAQPSLATWNWTVLLLVAGTALFAGLDIMNKKLMIGDESLLSMLFFSALGTTLLSFPFALLDWQWPTLFEWGMFCVLGCGANLLLYCLLRAFQFCDLSSLQPFRYTELLFSTTLGALVFDKLPDGATLMGAALIIPATLYVTYAETRDAGRRDAALCDEEVGAPDREDTSDESDTKKSAVDLLS